MTDYDVIIAGSGPIACTYANTILKKKSDAKILMIEIGSQENPTPGANLKNALKYRKDIDSFVNVIKGALQPISIPPAEAYVATLGGSSWRPKDGVHQFHGCNPEQKAYNNLRASAITRTVGGMATHWTCCCPRPEETEERKVGKELINKDDFDKLFGRAGKLLSVQEDPTVNFFEKSIRHKAVKMALKDFQPGNLPLGVQRLGDSDESKRLVWTGSDTVLASGLSGEVLTKVKRLIEHRVTKLMPNGNNSKVDKVEVFNYATGKPEYFSAKAFVVACGAICTPQILWNSSGAAGWIKKMRPDALGRYLSEQSIAFCQVVLSEPIIDSIGQKGQAGANYQEFKEVIKKHKEDYPKDELPIPFDDEDPQVYLPYRLAENVGTPNETKKRPWHVQVHRDAFSYGEVGPKVDSRLVVDLRFFGKSEVVKKNCVVFPSKDSQPGLANEWKPKSRDIYGMPQPTFKVERSEADKIRDQEVFPNKDFQPVYANEWKPSRDIYGMPQPTFEVERSPDDMKQDQEMMEEMCKVANKLGGYLPGSYPQFMEPGLALHITGTTRMGKETEKSTSVVDPNSKVHDVENLWLGGNGVIPDSMACNPTRTSMAYAIKGAEALVDYLNKP